MPSLFSSSTSGSQTATTSKLNGGRMLSRVHSISRNWGDEEDEPVVAWSPSPERVKRKLPYPPPSATSPAKLKVNYNGNVKDELGMTPAERRRQAMQALMSSNIPDSAPVPGPSSSTTLVASSFVRPTPTPANKPLILSSAMRIEPPTPSLPPPQILPDLPGALEDAKAGLPSKKRPLPWEGQSKPEKKSVRTESNGSAGSKSSAKAGGSATNIKQKLCLSAEQQKVLQLVVNEGKNIFFTGSAGTGKSVLLREIIKSLQKKHVKAGDAVAVTASTGIAACNIGGVTLHSFGGAGLCLEEPAVLVKKIKMNKKAAARWLRTKVLIIDEVSMVDADLFDKFNKVGQMLRKKTGTPFGGIQIVVTGDFFQLPPVSKGTPKFCFEAETWNTAIHMSVNLTKVFRQKDARFVDMLNEMRFGRLSPNSIIEFRKLSRPIPYNDGIQPTELFPRREEVEKANLERLKSLNEDGWTYNATDGGAVTDPVQREKLLSNFMAPPSIMLKIGAQVMLIKNLDTELVNGSMGIVIGFSHRQLFETNKYGQWAPEGDIEGYEGEELEKKLKLRELLNAKQLEGGRPYPVVRFKITTPNAGSGVVREMLMEPDSFKTELPNGEIQASRNQIPLILSWAMSIHKSQGQTLDRVKVDLGKVFEKGQAYVALSRATTLEGLQVLGFSADKVMAHPKVAKWSASLKDLNIA